jgi:hypothetical protein
MNENGERTEHEEQIENLRRGQRQLREIFLGSFVTLLVAITMAAFILHLRR